MIKVQSFAEGKWHFGSADAREVSHAVTGEPFARVSSSGIDFEGMLRYGRGAGGTALRQMTFHERARMLKAIALHLTANKEQFYKLSLASGATKNDAWFDIDGGIGTLFVYSSKGRRELPDERMLVDGNLEALSRNGSFVGHHVCVPLEGVAVHINAYNFPCWGMLEKLAPTFLAGMPAIVKPASVTSYVAEAVVRSIIDSGILPDGALQLISGSTGDLLDHMTGQDVVTFTGSASTGIRLKQTDAILRSGTRFNMEADSLNFTMLGPDIEPASASFDLFIKEVAKEMTIKAGQRCTAIRRTFVPSQLVQPVVEALIKRLGGVTVGNPAVESVRMGPLVSEDQRTEVLQNIELLVEAGSLVMGGRESMNLVDADYESGCFVSPTLILCDEPSAVSAPHEIEAFGPVNTIMPYDGIDDAVALTKLGRGSLVGSLVTDDDDVARQIVLGTASHHGRLLFLNQGCAAESTGHGSPMPHLVHGGPGRAGGGEELGGIRGVKHYMQTTAIQGSPTTLTHVTSQWMTGAARPESTIHPFRKTFDQLSIGDTLTTHRRTITESDIGRFAGISGDFFYAHMDEIAAANSIFAKRVAHGYFVVSAAAGLFVHPGEGPVLANYGLESLRFIEPVFIGDTIYVKLTCRRKIKKEKREGEQLQGVVEWNVDVFNQEDIVVATYIILTLVRRAEI
jgi:oxepin-CoA hydrolase/3-oxo-5,6-dehydrosuberyl-CoA semialdehyde dehydrogenase